MWIPKLKKDSNLVMSNLASLHLDVDTWAQFGESKAREIHLP